MSVHTRWIRLARASSPTRRREWHLGGCAAAPPAATSWRRAETIHAPRRPRSGPTAATPSGGRGRCRRATVALRRWRSCAHARRTRTKGGPRPDAFSATNGARARRGRGNGGAPATVPARVSTAGRSRGVVGLDGLYGHDLPEAPGSGRGVASPTSKSLRDVLARPDLGARCDGAAPCDLRLRLRASPFGAPPPPGAPPPGLSSRKGPGTLMLRLASPASSARSLGAAVRRFACRWNTRRVRRAPLRFAHSDAARSTRRSATSAVPAAEWSCSPARAPTRRGGR